MTSDNNKKPATPRNPNVNHSQDHGQVISIDHLLDIKVERDQKVRKIKELVSSGRYKVESEKLSKILYEGVFSDDDTPSHP